MRGVGAADGFIAHDFGVDEPALGLDPEAAEDPRATARTRRGAELREARLESVERRLWELVALSLEGDIAARARRDDRHRGTAPHRSQTDVEGRLGQLAGAEALERAAQAERDRALECARARGHDDQAEPEVAAVDLVLAGEGLMEQLGRVVRAAAAAGRKPERGKDRSER